ncbi:MAG: HAD family phosphatase [Acidobacteriaceae bacterium]
MSLWDFLELKALVFDFDGVLADTEPLYWQGWADLLAAYDIPFTWNEYCKFGRGIKDEQMFATLPPLASQPATLSSVMKQLKDRKEIIRQCVAQHSLIGASTVCMLQSLKKYKIGLVTTSEREEVEPMLRRAGIYECFQALVFGGDVQRQKPHPEPYFRIRQQLGVETGITFEDSDVGLRSAAEAGLTVIHVAHPRDLPEVGSRTLRLLSN